MDTAETSIDIATEEQSIEVKTDNSAENESTNDTSNLDKTEPVPIDVPVNPEKIEIARLSSIITKQTNEISDLNARLAACQQHYETLLNRQKEENSREKQSTVMRYAQAEKAKLDSDKRCEVLATKNNDLLKEKDNLQVKLSEFKLMNTKLQNAYEHKLSELAALKKELEKTKEINQSIDASLKSTLNHLKGESSHLKEQRESNERLRRDLNEQHELNEQLKLQCKQLTEAAQAIPTDDEHAQAFDTLHNEHNALKGKLTNIQDENKLLREKLKSSDEDRLALENVIENFRQTTMREKETTKKLYDDLLAAREQDSVEMSRLKQIEFLYNQTLADNADLRQLLEKEHQLLELTQKLTEKNSILQSDYEQLQLLHKGTSTDFECIQKINEEQKSQIAKLENIEKSLRDQLKELDEKYQTVNKLYEQTVKQYDDSLSEIQTLKKKHQANTKDLIKQLQQLQKPKSTNNILHKQNSFRQEHKSALKVEDVTRRQQLANKNRNNSSSLMATLYNRATTTVNHTTNKLFEQSSPMTLETALDVMGKLQSVLEDTLLKNITLKENVDTLNKKMPIVKSASTISESTTNEAREALDCLHELSQLLNTGLDKKTLTACVRLLEAGVHPDALAQIVQVLRSETRPTKL
ncbi:unnamed protein product [Rotaria magnacalcarata]|uniref:Uncharacterized protein n=1 Tax=Rotaria magnacalcarata TaxID=392030 RepID=A0A819AXB5_9BILA|nr:unnamed protein product [Rotaria magnacalcarata]